MRMRILDRQRYWSFVKAYVVCFVSLVGLYVVIHAFANLDEFGKAHPRADAVLRAMGRYYLVRASLFYDQLCGVITMMAAIFTVTWMQRDNQLLAILAAGVSARRAIRPVIVCSILVSSLAILNHELVLPRYALELGLKPDDDGKSPLPVTNFYDVNDILIHGRAADRQRRCLTLTATLPVSLTGTLHGLEAREAYYIPPDHPSAPLKGGWILRGVQILPPLPDNFAGPIELLTPDQAESFPEPPPPLAESAESANPPAPANAPAAFLFTNVSFDMLTRDRQWYQYAPTPELVRALSDPSNSHEARTIEIQVHNRMLKPLLSLTVLFLTLPLVISGPKRDMVVNLGLALVTSVGFYATLFLTQYLGANGALSPTLSAYLPLMIFGTIAAWNWGNIRT